MHDHNNHSSVVITYATLNFATNLSFLKSILLIILLVSGNVIVLCSMYYKNAIKICNVLSVSVEAVDSFYKFSDMVIVLLKAMTCTVVHDSSCRLTNHIMQEAAKLTASVYKALCVLLCVQHSV